MDAAVSSLKRPLELPAPVTPQKRQRHSVPCAGSITPESSNRTRRTPVKRKDPPGWKDIPKWTHNRSPFLELPVELLDKITGPSSELELQDHLSLASSCRTLRDAYSEIIWRDLLFYKTSSLPPFSHSLSQHIFSSALEASSKTKGKGKVEEWRSPFRFRTRIAEEINTLRITKTEAIHNFKISEKDLTPLAFQQKRNPHCRRGGAPQMKLYIKAQVRALALRIHGGPLGHEAHISRRAQIAEKTRVTKEKNGTTPKKKERKIIFTPVEDDEAYLFTHIDQDDEFEMY